MRRLAVLLALLSIAATWPQKGDVVYMPVTHTAPLTVVTGPHPYTAEACTALTVKKSKPGLIHVAGKDGLRWILCGDWNKYLIASESECRQVEPDVSVMAPQGCQVILPH